MHPKDLRPTWAEINLDALADNIRKVKEIIRRETLLMAIVKANAYGHGAVPASKVFLDNGGDRLGVATVNEGVELRRSGINAPILNLGYTPQNQYDLLIENGISATIYNYNQAITLNEAATHKGKTQNIHIKLDTGMGRIGFLPENDALDAMTKISDLSNLHLEGVFTHFATSDELNKTYTHHQYKIFARIVEDLETRGVNIPIKHVSNSASILDLPEYDLDMVRPGIILYGFLPRKGYFVRNIVLKPALTLKSRLSNVKKVSSGIGIGYGLTFKTRQPSIIGTIPIGYADGLMRGLSNHGWTSVRGRKANIIGRISMDQCMVDLTNNFGAEIGDEVVVFGGNGAQTTDDIANIMGTIGDEILCAISRRVPRVYFKSGRIVEIRDYLIN